MERSGAPDKWMVRDGEKPLRFDAFQFQFCQKRCWGVELWKTKLEKMHGKKFDEGSDPHANHVRDVRTWGKSIISKDFPETGSWNLGSLFRMSVYNLQKRSIYRKTLVGIAVSVTWHHQNVLTNKSSTKNGFFWGSGGDLCWRNPMNLFLWVFGKFGLLIPFGPQFPTNQRWIRNV